jgi:type I restriction enzyme, R subunit
VTGTGGDAYLTPEAKARVEIDRRLAEAGWVVQNVADFNAAAGRGVAVREFVLAKPHGRADYLLFLDGQPVGSVEAKPAGATLTGVEEQSIKYTTGGLPDYLSPPLTPLPFAYESTGIETRFTNMLDPHPTSRWVFHFHRPETMAEWVRQAQANPAAPSLRGRLHQIPELDPVGLWPAQATAIKNLEASLRDNRPRALIQMATGAGKTRTACNIAYRLIKHADAKRVLFLVDRANLGRQTQKEFQQFDTPDDGRKFTELYNVQHLASNKIDPVSRVCISTIQRLFSMLKGEQDLPADLDEQSALELGQTEPVPVEYNPRIPIEMFDFIIVDEAHRSIYNLWRQVLEYFDAFLIGLTATPNKQTFGFFNQNLVMEYTHEQAVADKVNVDFDVYRIRTEITEKGSKIDAGIVTGFRDRETREVRWRKVDDDVAYAPPDLDRKVIAKDQIRTVIRTFKENLFTEIFPDRTQVPKTLIFAKDDSHADDIVQVVREEFGRGNDFAVKITYRTTGRKTDELIAEFRNSVLPRIAVTVDMIATGTDVKPLECVMFMRSVRSRTFFEQMKGRGVRVINDTDFQAVTPDAKFKDHFVIVDAIGVTESPLTDTQPLERNKTVPFETLLKQVSFGNRDPEVISSIASRLARLDRQLTQADREDVEELAGQPLVEITRALVEALDPDNQLARARAASATGEPTEAEIGEATKVMLTEAVQPLATNPPLRELLVEVRRSYEQAIDEASKDVVIEAGYSADAAERARSLVTSFRQFIEDHKDEITALQVLYSTPYARRLTFKEIKELAHAIGRPPRQWTPERLWQAYEALDRSKVRGSPERTLTDLVSLVRYALDQDDELEPFAAKVKERFEAWLAEQRQAGRDFSQEQLRWLERIRDHIATSLAITPEDFEYTPFAEEGGLGKATQVLGDDLPGILDALSEVLAA